MRLHLITSCLLTPISLPFIQANSLTEKQYDERFFNIKKWTEDEKDEIFDTMLAIKELGDSLNLEKPDERNTRRKIRGNRNRKLNDNNGYYNKRKRIAPQGLSISHEAMLEEEKKFEDFVLKENLLALDPSPVSAVEEDAPITAQEELNAQLDAPVIERDYHRKSGKKGSKKGSKSSKSSKGSKSGKGSSGSSDAICPDPDSTTLPCPEPEIHQVCDKYDEEGDFKACFDMCKESFCCVHDSRSRRVAPTCSKTEANCQAYDPCYIIWWKLSDTVGPAPYFYVSQRGDDFFPEFDDYIDTFDDMLMNQLLGHYFDDDTVEEGRFENPDNW